mmetsp:Transcript_62575/g.139356  ORF Transcript_62575/g.139356 Transcript_62575/m.139356 type:complete len:204 (+) Transcript_62575:262-873(+)
MVMSCAGVSSWVAFTPMRQLGGSSSASRRWQRLSSVWKCPRVQRSQNQIGRPVRCRPSSWSTRRLTVGSAGRSSLPSGSWNPPSRSLPPSELPRASARYPSSTPAGWRGRPCGRSLRRSIRRCCNRCAMRLRGRASYPGTAPRVNARACAPCGNTWVPCARNAPGYSLATICCSCTLRLHLRRLRCRWQARRKRAYLILKWIE